MPGGIVYEGVTPQDGRGGDIFDGKAFYVSLRIPHRQTCIRNIENNGGTIAKLEKNADYYLADPNRADAPPGSYSYQMVEDALKAGSLDSAEDYLCIAPPPARTSSTQTPASPAMRRPTGTQAKATRQKFTEEEDRELGKFVTFVEKRSGRGSSGNEIFKYWAEKHPTHTWQSWRDRWVKKLRLLPRPSVAEDEFDLPPRNVQSAGTGPRIRAKFTNEEDRILIEHVRDSLSEGLGLGGNKIYAELANNFPQHSMHSWRDRWLKQLEPRFLDDDGNWTREFLEGLSHPPNQQGARPKAKLAPKPAESVPARAAPGSSIKHLGPNVQSSAKSMNGGSKIRDRRDEASTRRESSSPESSEESGWERQDYKRQDADDTGRAGLLPDDPLSPEKGTLSPRDTDSNQHKRQGKLRDQGQNTESGPTKSPPSADNLQLDQHGESKQAWEAPRSTRERLIDSTLASTEQAKASRDPSNKGSNDGFEDVENQNPSSRHQEGEGLIEQKSLQSPSSPPSLSLEAGQHPDADSLGEHITPKEQFYRDYNAFVQNVGIQPKPWASIAGQTIDIWNLWRAVESQKREPEDRDWELIAETLGFNWAAQESVVLELQRHYEDQLAPFEEALASFDDADEEASDVDGEDGEDTALDTMSGLPSSPPGQPSLKRQAEAAVQFSDQSYPYTSPKRRRLDRQGEIPSTPDEANGTSHLRQPTGPSPTPVTQRGVDLQDDDDYFEELPASPTPRKRVVEPETQDSRFDPETQGIAFDDEQETALTETQANITPSQQLQLESSQQDMEEVELGSRKVPSNAGPSSSLPPASLPRHTPQNPFQSNESDEEIPVPLKEKKTAVSRSRGKTRPQPRHLPRSWRREADPGEDVFASPAPHQQTNGSHGRSPQDRPSMTVAPEEDTPDSVIDRFVALGYSQDIVIRALKATTWNIGHASHVMETLRSGQELPQRTSGVWTQRDDDSLMLVNSTNPPQDAKEERRREKHLKRLTAKHGPERMEARRVYLTA
ncbi:hypothetical protein F4780DRAFT_784509 [Xylariomycetidae sp. FL0641]|nr:hypothetical protein F4780DRAFT_784509 [Xylariomycetidae sp. FL0641]